MDPKFLDNWDFGKDCRPWPMCPLQLNIKITCLAGKFDYTEAHMFIFKILLCLSITCTKLICINES